MNRKQAHILIFCISISLILAAPTPQTHAAFQGPPAGANPPTGGGLMGVDPNRNIQLFDIQAGSANATPLGTLDGAPFGRVFMVTASNNPGIGVKNINAGRGYVFAARNNGTLALWDDVAGAVRLYVDVSGNIVVGSTDPALAKLHVFGNIRTESSFIGGRMQASYLASDVFGDFTGGGNFAFPAALGIGVGSIGGLPTNGLYVAGNVGIGTTDPLSGATWASPSLEVSGTRGTLGLTTVSPSGLSTIRFKGPSINSEWHQNFVDGADNSLRFFSYQKTGGAGEVLTLKGTGNIGIGTTGPGSKLTVAGDVHLIGSRTIYFEGGTADPHYFIQSFPVPGSAALRMKGYGGVRLTDATGDVLSIASGGVGIGTTNPGTTLEISAPDGTGPLLLSTPSPDLYLETGPTHYNWRIAAQEDVDAGFTIGSGAQDNNALDDTYTPHLTILQNGLVRIGTPATSPSPSTKLHVAGDIKVEGDVIANNTGAATAISAANVSQGTFGSLSTKGNYKFEGAVSTNPVFFIDATNEKVGIGTAGPTEKLEVAGNATITNGKFTISHNSDAVEQYFQDSADSDYFKWRFQRNADVLGLHSSGVPYPSYIMAITKTGNVGIGTANPQAKLDVSDGANSTRIYGNAAGDISSTNLSPHYGSGVFTIYSGYPGSGVARLRINESGNVGIGTPSPGQKLQVAGNIMAVGGVGAYTQAISSMGKIAYMQGVNLLATNWKGALFSFDTYFDGMNWQIPGDGANTEAAALTTQGGGIQFYTRGSSGAMPVTLSDAQFVALEKMRIDPNGNVGIGNTDPRHALDIQGAYYSRMVVKGSVSGAVTINWNEGNVQHITLVGNITLTFTNGQSGGRYVLIVKQDATGGRTVMWPANARFPGSSTFNVTTSPNRTDYFGFLYNGVDLKYDNVAFSAAFF